MLRGVLELRGRGQIGAVRNPRIVDQGSRVEAADPQSLGLSAIAKGDRGRQQTHGNKDS